MDLDGRVALVTGGARRVGRAIAERLARAGCRLAVHYHNSETEARDTVLACEAAGREAAAFGADLADGEATRGLIPAVLKRYGRLDILVNNAAVFEPMSLDDFDAGDWDRQLRINLTAPMVLAHAARQSLRAAHGRIVNILDAGTSRPWAGHLAYCVSKGAMGTLTKAMAKAFAPEVNVTGIAPGIVDWPEEYSPERRARLIESVPLGRAGSASDVAAAVHFLAAEADYVTGAILSIDGGRQIA
jgi:NAD(P)-dependent dehydrogenase (short-subunit alcohol dehydrogenase family)